MHRTAYGHGSHFAGTTSVQEWGILWAGCEAVGGGWLGLRGPHWQWAQSLGCPDAGRNEDEAPLTSRSVWPPPHR